MLPGQTEGAGSADFRRKRHLRGINLALICLGLLSVGAATAGEHDTRWISRGNRGSDQASGTSPISEPVSLVLLAAGLGLSARGLRRCEE